MEIVYIPSDLYFYFATTDLFLLEDWVLRGSNTGCQIISCFKSVCFSGIAYLLVDFIHGNLYLILVIFPFLQLTEWISTGGMVSAETAAVASEECDKMLRMGDRVGRAAYDKKKLLLYAIVSGSRRHIDRLLRDLPTLFNTIEDFLWFKLSAVRDCPGGSSSVVLNEGLVPYSLDDLQNYLNKFEPSYYTKNGKDPLVYPYVLLLSIQLLPTVLYLSKEMGVEGYNVDATHISIVLADHGVLSEGAGAGQKLGVMDAFAEASSIIRQYGLVYLRSGDLSTVLEYYAQAAAAVGGGQLSWTGKGNIDQQWQRNLMLKQLLTELLLRDGGIYLLLGPRGAGEEGELSRFMTDVKARQQFLLEASCQCQDAGLYDRVILLLMLTFSFFSLCFRGLYKDNGNLYKLHHAQVGLFGVLPTGVSRMIALSCFNLK